MKSLSLVALLTLTALAFAGAPHAAQDNEDLRYIRKWQMQQKAAALAGELHLSAEQAATLRRVKSAVEAVEAEYKPRFDALESRTDALAAEVRGRIESSGTLSEADQTALRDLRRQHRELRKEQRGRIESAAAELEGFLTADQIAILRERAHEHRDQLRERARGAGIQQRADLRQHFRDRTEQRAELRERRGQAGDRALKRGERRSERAERHKHLAARLLLSDAFIDALD